jgi:hypothetical protein
LTVDGRTRLLTAGLVGGALAALTVIILLMLQIGELRDSREG